MVKYFFLWIALSIVEFRMLSGMLEDFGQLQEDFGQLIVEPL